MVIQIVAPILGHALRQGARYVYRGLRAQDRIIDYTYRRTGLYNRGAVRGIKHGLAGGQIVGGTLNLGLQGLEPDGIPEKRNRFKTYRQQKTRSRYSNYRRRNDKYCRRYNRRRC